MKKIKGSFLFKIKGPDGKTQEWLVDLKSPPGSVQKGKSTTCIFIKMFTRYYLKLSFHYY